MHNLLDFQVFFLVIRNDDEQEMHKNDSSQHLAQAEKNCFLFFFT
jgi:hypothetical protein